MKTLVNFILDKSGSMQSVKQSTINGFNEYIQELRKKEGDYSFSLTLFDSSVETVLTNVPLSEVKELNLETYKPDGSTALYDAVCQTVEKVERTMTPDQKSLVIIMTDGEENASQKFSHSDIKFLIDHLKRTEKWSFVFLGSNQDAWAKAKDFGISAMNAVTYNSTGAGVRSAFMNVATATSNFSEKTIDTSFSGPLPDFFTADQQKDIQDTK